MGSDPLSAMATMGWRTIYSLKDMTTSRIGDRATLMDIDYFMRHSSILIWTSKVLECINAWLEEKQYDGGCMELLSLM